jgi:hypothetical protein
VHPETTGQCVSDGPSAVVDAVGDDHTHRVDVAARLKARVPDSALVVLPAAEMPAARCCAGRC